MGRSGSGIEVWCAAYVYDYESLGGEDIFAFSSQTLAQEFIAEQPKRNLPGRWAIWRGVTDTKEPFTDPRFD